QTIKLQFTYNGSEYIVEGMLTGVDEFAVIGEAIPIRINPDEPRIWTSSPHPPPLGQILVPSLIAIPLAAIALVIAILTRSRILALFRDGEPRKAIVAEVRRNALAPLSLTL